MTFDKQGKWILETPVPDIMQLSRIGVRPKVYKTGPRLDLFLTLSLDTDLNKGYWVELAHYFSLF